MLLERGWTLETERERERERERDCVCVWRRLVLFGRRSVSCTRMTISETEGFICVCVYVCVEGMVLFVQ